MISKVIFQRGEQCVKKLRLLLSFFLWVSANSALAHEGGIGFIKCEEREILLDTDTGRLDITAFRTGEWTRGVKFENGVERIRFQVVTTNYIEGWAIDRETLMAVSHLQVFGKPDMEPVPPVVGRTQCEKEDRESSNQI
jgi:hypothetical protein